MKICHITAVHPRHDVRIFWKECVSLAESGNEVYLIVNDEFDDEIISGVNIKSIKGSSKSRIARIICRKDKSRIYKKAQGLKADVYHFHDPELLGIGIKLKRSGFRVVYDSHEDVPRQILFKEWIPAFIRQTVSKIFELFENQCVRAFDAIIVPTPTLKERFSKLNHSVWEVCNFPSTIEIKNSGASYSNKNPGCYIGDLTFTRGIREIAEATHRAGLKLILCGTFHSKGLKDELLEKYDHISYLGFLSRPEVLKVLSESSIGFVTLHNTLSYSVAYPIKIFEYMAVGIPVISSNFPLYRKIVEENRCGICVDPLDIDAISDSIKKIVDDKDYADELRINGCNAIRNKYNWEKQVEVLNRCYNYILKLT